MWTQTDRQAEEQTDKHEEANIHSSRYCERTQTGLRRKQDFFFLPVALRPNADHGLIILEVSKSHTAMHHVWWYFSGQSNQLFAETSTWKHATLITDKHPFPRRDSNRQSQHASDRRPTPKTARPVGQAESRILNIKPGGAHGKHRALICYSSLCVGLLSYLLICCLYNDFISRSDSLSYGTVIRV